MELIEFSFGLFDLDPNQHQLTREGVPVPVGNRALDILCVLASAKGEIVSKDELMTKVWPGLVVEENNIEVHVSALRKVLDEGKGGQTHLVTVPGRGYRLVGLRPLHLPADGRSDSSLGPAPSEKPSIAVLPFQNMSGDPTGVFRGWHGGRNHHRAVAHKMAFGDLPQLDLHLQEQ